MSEIRVGQGYDIHRLVAGSPLMIGGVHIDSPLGSEAHSDGDVVLHALIDALLGAAGLGDIGEHFPPSDNRYKDSDSAVLLAHAYSLVRAAGWRLVNLDATLFLERPKLSPYKQAIAERLAELLGLEASRVSMKAKTAEGLPPVGTGEAIAAAVTVLLAQS